MKQFLLATLVVMSSFAFAEQPATKEVTLGLSEVYVPGGFGPDTDAFVVASGMFPNSCYRWNRADVTHKSQNFHEIRAIATVSQTMCLMVLVPYNKDIRLGQLPSGEHTLRFVNGDGTYFERTLVVE